MAEATFCVIAGLRPDASCRYESLINLRYRLNVGLDDTVRGGRPHGFEVTAGHHSQADGAPIASVAIAVSYDDGASWRPARLRARHGKYVVTVVIRRPATCRSKRPPGTAQGTASSRR